MIQFDAKTLAGLSAEPERPKLPTEVGFYLGKGQREAIVVEVRGEGTIFGSDGTLLTNPERYAPYERLVPQSELLGSLDPVQQMRVGSHLMESITTAPGHLFEYGGEKIKEYAQYFKDGFDGAIREFEEGS